MGEATGDRISVGYVRRAHGIKGDVIVRSLTDHPERFSAGAVFESGDQPPRRLDVVRSQTHPDGYLVTFAGVTDRSSAEALQGTTLTIGAHERRKLGENEFWPEDLQGLIAVDRQTGQHLGTVVGVVLADVQDRLTIETASGELVEVPFVSEIVGDVHPSGSHVVLDPPEGMFPDT